jgi:hypothetical protein
VPIRSPILVIVCLTTLVGASGSRTAYMVFGFPGSYTHADTGEGRQPAHGTFIRGGPIRVEELAKICPALDGSDTSDVSDSPHGDTLFVAGCHLARYDTLDSGDGGPWATATYRHLYVYSHDSPVDASPTSPASRDSVTIDDAVLYGLDRDGTLQPVWHDTYDRADTWELKLTAARHPTGVLFSLQYCVNGTGGCHQDFMLRHGSTWTDVIEAFVQQLPTSMHDALWKGVSIDVRTLHAEAPVYRQTDSNCCPSQYVSMALEMHGDSLVLRSYRLRPATADSSGR